MPLNLTYIGHTIRTLVLSCLTLERRLRALLQIGAIKQHHKLYQRNVTDRETTVNSTTIVVYCSDHKKLQMLETVYVRDNTN